MRQIRLPGGGAAARAGPRLAPRRRRRERTVNKPSWCCSRGYSACRCEVVRRQILSDAWLVIQVLRLVGLPPLHDVRYRVSTGMTLADLMLAQAQQTMTTGMAISSKL
ncbi:small integral membrane protein 20 isoform X2 [Athene noctua]|uniref:small integral membrane protein 20 isoform X2 n=1 Tax=Athene noctua TaxID=126797 RepID=UPI003EBAB701